MQKNRTRLLLLAVWMLLPALCGCLPEEDPPLPVPVSEIKPVSYATIALERMDVELRASGTLQIEADVQTAVANIHRRARVIAVHVQTGDYVEAGDLLFELDHGFDPFEVQKAEMLYEISALQYERDRARYQAQQISEIQFKETELDYLKQKNGIELLRAELAAASVTAPVSGHITAFGETAAAGANVSADAMLCIISDLSAFTLRYTGKNYTLFSLGDACVVHTTVNGEPAALAATVVQTRDQVPGSASALEKTSVLIRLDAPLALSDAVYTDFLADHVFYFAENALVVIRRHVYTDTEDRPFVYILEDGLRKVRYIETGIQFDSYYEVLDGLTDSDVLIST